ncbi:Miro-like protein/Ras family [Novymonas esmeraldas]|uniref:Miro-like protein/Ras family n=1 Tax=Novymonas esmeraldas TaxID=1808958 RepID=A0AAW0EX75_9TRYP
MSAISVVVLGGAGVGKSCLTIQYIHAQFTEEYSATIEDVYRTVATVDGVSTVMTVVDTAGENAFEAVRDQYLCKGHGFVLAYSVTDADSLRHVRRVYADLRRARMGRPAPCVVVANKSDKVPHRVVSREAGAQLATDIGAAFIEGTARDHATAESVFEQLVRAIRGSTAASDDEAPQPSSAAAQTGAAEPTTATLSNTRATSGEKRSTGRGGKRWHHRCTVL